MSSNATPSQTESELTEERAAQQLLERLRTATLGEYDFVAIVEADDNETVARFSLELGVAAGVHVETMPAIPITRSFGKPETAEAR